MQARFAANGAEFRARLERDAEAVAAAAGEAVEETTTRTKEKVRARILVGFRGARRVATIVRGDFFKAKPGKAPTGYVYSNWFKRGEDILAGFAKGATIRPRNGKFLLVPADQAPGFKAKARIALELLGRAARIAIIVTRAGKRLLIERGDKKTTILGSLVKFVKLPKRFTVDDVPAEAERHLAEGYAAKLQKKGL